MAKALNKNRILFSRFIVVLSIALIFVTREVTTSESIAHSLLDLAGYSLVVICGMGRLYTTAFLGGHKNKELIMAGPFSVVRNPLYVFSWLGFTGFALFSTNLWVILIVPFSFMLLYHALVRREEEYLREKFGESFTAYCARVPRFIPRFSGFVQPEQLILTPHTFMRGLLDNIWWFAIPPLFEFFEEITDFTIL